MGRLPMCARTVRNARVCLLVLWLACLSCTERSSDSTGPVVRLGRARDGFGLSKAASENQWRVFQPYPSFNPPAWTDGVYGRPGSPLYLVQAGVANPTPEARFNYCRWGEEGIVVQVDANVPYFDYWLAVSHVCEVLNEHLHYASPTMSDPDVQLFVGSQLGGYFVPSLAYNQGDGVSGIYFIQSRSDPLFDLLFFGTCDAAKTLWYIHVVDGPSGRRPTITEFEVYVNAVDFDLLGHGQEPYDLQCPPPSGGRFRIHLASLLLHEFMHGLGIAHHAPLLWCPGACTPVMCNGLPDCSGVVDDLWRDKDFPPLDFLYD